jgi:hypothetical protein
MQRETNSKENAQTNQLKIMNIKFGRIFKAV